MFGNVAKLLNNLEIYLFIEKTKIIFRTKNVFLDKVLISKNSHKN